MSEIIVNAIQENMVKVLSFIEEQLESADCPMKIVNKIAICVEEIYVNVVNYAYNSENLINSVENSGKCIVNADIIKNDSGKIAVICIKDKGVPFNPLENETPDTTLTVEERKIGGLGIFMVKKMMDEVTYRYEDSMNILTMVKAWQ